MIDGADFCMLNLPGSLVDQNFRLREYDVGYGLLNHIAGSHTLDRCFSRILCSAPANESLRRTDWIIGNRTVTLSPFSGFWPLPSRRISFVNPMVVDSSFCMQHQLSKRAVSSSRQNGFDENATGYHWSYLYPLFLNTTKRV